MHRLVAASRGGSMPNFSAMGLGLAVLLSGCCFCSPVPEYKLEPKPEPKPETYHLQVDGYGVEVLLLPEVYTGFFISTATLTPRGGEAISRADLDPVSPPHWKAIEIVAKQKCPNGYDIYYRDWSPPALVPLLSISARYLCPA